MKKITRIEYSYLSGSILPELQLNEVYRITSNSVTFIRNGVVEVNRVNTGEWQVPFTQSDIDQLFANLLPVDCSKIKQVTPDDAPDGGHTLGYTIQYDEGKSCSLFYFPGTTYTDGELITEPIHLFIGKLKLPAEAAVQYKE